VATEKRTYQRRGCWQGRKKGKKKHPEAAEKTKPKIRLSIKKGGGRQGEGGRGGSYEKAGDFPALGRWGAKEGTGELEGQVKWKGGDILENSFKVWLGGSQSRQVRVTTEEGFSRVRRKKKGIRRKRGR